MIRWDLTGTTKDNTKLTDCVNVECDSCHKISIHKYKSMKYRKDDVYFCLSCRGTRKWQDKKYESNMKKSFELSKPKHRDGILSAFKNKSYRDKISDNQKRLWNNKEYKQNQSNKTKQQWKNAQYRKQMVALYETDDFKSIYRTKSHRDKMSKISKKAWSDQDYIDKMSKIRTAMWRNESYRERMKLLFASDEYRNKMKIISEQMWSNSVFREKMNKICYHNESWLKKISDAKMNQNSVSNIQEQLYSTLDDLNIKYYREYNNKQNDQETMIGPYHFDCVIPINNKKLLIECQGDYWHSLTKTISNDKAKATYIEKYHSDCEIKYLWEHEFKCQNKIVELIKYWLNITEIELVDFSFNNVEIKKCLPKDYKLLLSKYHYLPNAGRGGVAYGAYLKDELIAVCVFSSLVRQNMPWNKESTRELSRLCIHPRYQKKNFASWFISRCIKQLSEKYKTIISYCDTTFNHDGAVYKASNFKLDGEVKPDYWYVSEDGWVMHKKTLYNHARKMSMKEKDYAELNRYMKVCGKEKLRFIYQR